MSFSVPTFPLLYNAWTFGSNPPAAARVSGAPGNLAYGRRFHAAPFSQVGDMSLLVPLGTDLRSGINSAGGDLIEVPAGTGRFYRIVTVDDVGKGFANEFRAALIQQTRVLNAPWPVPIP